MVQQPQTITIKVNTTSLFLSLFAAVFVAVFAAYMLMKSEFASAIQQQTATQTPVVVAQPNTCVSPTDTKGSDASQTQSAAWAAPIYYGGYQYGASSIVQNQTDNHSVTNNTTTTTNNTSTVKDSYNTVDSNNRTKLEVEIEDSFNIASFNTMKHYNKTVTNVTTNNVDDHSTNLVNNTLVNDSEEVIVLSGNAALAPLGL